MKTKNKTNLNAYLFGNLVILCVLLISLWNRKPVWDVNLRFPNLLLILVIINSILIFKGLIMSDNASGTTRKSGKTNKSLAPLRSIIPTTSEINDNLFIRVLEKLKDLSRVDATAILLPDGKEFDLVASSGELPVSFKNAKLIKKDDALFIKFSENLGEEKISSSLYKFRPLKFKSSATRLELTLYPLKLKNGNVGILLFTSKSGHKHPRLPYNSTALYVETVIAVIKDFATSSDLKYKDKSTGLLKYECFAEAFETEIERSERYQQDMTLMSAKIKFCQDTQEKDKKQLQKAAAVALKESLRRLDLMFCGQQDCEFIAILNETGKEVAEIVASRVQKSFAKQLEKFEINNEKNRILFIGSATYPTDATHGHGLMEKSGEALKKAEEEDKAFVSYDINQH
ncbi:MAG: diguanylate cyclase domain-containing protein [Candidatus Rifleibacteriota bacterium]